MKLITETASETARQTAICDGLHYLSRQYQFLFFSVPNELLGKVTSKGGLARMGKYRRMGLRAGVADLVIVQAGKAYFLEVKASGYQTAQQREFEADCARVGAPYAIVRSLDDVLEKLVEWGVVDRRFLVAHIVNPVV